MKPFDTTTLGGRIAIARKARRLTQADLAKLAGITQSSVALLENGSSKTSHNAVELAQALEVPVEWLLNGEGAVDACAEKDSPIPDAGYVDISRATHKSLDTLAARLTFLREQHRLSQAQLAAKTGLSQATIGNLETGRNKGTKKILELAKALHIRPEWLIQGGDLNQAKAAFLRKDLWLLPAEETKRQQFEKLLSGALVMPEGEDKTAQSSREPALKPPRILPIISWIDKALVTPGKAHLSHSNEGTFLSPFQHSLQAFWMRISFDVMEPEYFQNDLILVDPAVTPQSNDDVVILDDSGTAGFGRLRLTLSERYLETLNPKYPDRMHRTDDKTLIVGTVTALLRQRRAMA